MNQGIFTILLIQPLANGLILFYRLLGQNLGLAIIGFSIFLRLILTPLTAPYLKSMQNMRKYQGQLEKLKKRHKDDRKKLLEAQAQFYKEKGIRPGAGCLPYLLQIVVLIAFFQVFNRVLVGNGEVAAKFNELLYQPLKFVQDDSVSTQFFYLDLTQPDVFRLSFIPFALPGLFVILAAVTQFFTVKLSSTTMQQERGVAQKTADPSDDMQVAMQNSMIYTMPVITLLAGMRFASGLAVYWFVVSLFNAIQQSLAQSKGGLLQSLAAKTKDEKKD